MFKAILLDIDNTLYEYEAQHQKALEQVLNYLEKELSISREVALPALDQAKLYVKQNNPEKACSHNRLLYMQYLCENLSLPALDHSMPLYNHYWDTFLETLELSSGAMAFLQRYQATPICLVTDLTAHIQFRKVQRLGLSRWADFMVTSEEAGMEKPHPFMFQLALHKLGMRPEDVCMVGDNYKKDILGAKRLGIHAYWLTNNENHVQEEGITCISSLEDITW